VFTSGSDLYMISDAHFEQQIVRFLKLVMGSLITLNCVLRAGPLVSELWGPLALGLQLPTMPTLKAGPARDTYIHTFAYKYFLLLFLRLQ